MPPPPTPGRSSAHVVLALVAAALASALLAAHFHRSGSMALVAASFAMLPLLFVRRGWAARSVQIGLVLGAIEWLRTLAALAAARIAAGEPYLRLSLVLGGVAIATALAAVLFERPALRARYGLFPTPPHASEARDEKR